jgi:hypothetical protein
MIKTGPHKWHVIGAELVTEKVLTDPPQYVRTIRRMTDEAHRAKYPNALDEFIAQLNKEDG